MKSIKGKNGFYKIYDIKSSKNTLFFKHYTHKKEKYSYAKKEIKALFNPKLNKIMIMLDSISLIFIDGDMKVLNKIGKHIGKYKNIDNLKELLVKNNIILENNFVQTSYSFVVNGSENEGYTHFLDISINDIKLLQFVC